LKASQHSVCLIEKVYAEGGINENEGYFYTLQTQQCHIPGLWAFSMNEEIGWDDGREK